MRQLEHSGKDGSRAGSARGVFDALKLYMQPPPAPNLEKCALLAQTGRYLRYVVDINNKIEGDEEAEDVMVTDYAKDYWDCAVLSGIQSTYHIRATPALGTQQVQFRNLVCWCAHCIRGEFDECPLREHTGDFTVRKIRPPPPPTVAVDPNLMKIRKARKAQLTQWCVELGLRTGNVAFMKAVLELYIFIWTEDEDVLDDAAPAGVPAAAAPADVPAAAPAGVPAAAPAGTIPTADTVAGTDAAAPAAPAAPARNKGKKRQPGASAPGTTAAPAAATAAPTSKKRKKDNTVTSTTCSLRSVGRSPGTGGVVGRSPGGPEGVPGDAGGSPVGEGMASLDAECSLRSVGRSPGPAGPAVPAAVVVPAVPGVPVTGRGIGGSKRKRL